MKIKVLISGGIINAVLGDDEALEANIDIEIVEDDKEYEDHDQIQEYYEKLTHDPDLKEIDYTLVRFLDEDQKDLD